MFSPVKGTRYKATHFAGFIMRIRIEGRHSGQCLADSRPGACWLLCQRVGVHTSKSGTQMASPVRVFGTRNSEGICRKGCVLLPSCLPEPGLGDRGREEI